MREVTTKNEYKKYKKIFPNVELNFSFLNIYYLFQ